LSPRPPRCMDRMRWPGSPISLKRDYEGLETSADIGGATEAVTFSSNMAQWPGVAGVRQAGRRL
jgi:hypothetical protein